MFGVTGGVWRGVATWFINVPGEDCANETRAKNVVGDPWKPHFPCNEGVPSTALNWKARRCRVTYLVRISQQPARPHLQWWAGTWGDLGAAAVNENEFGEGVVAVTDAK